MSEITIISELCGQYGGSIRRAEQMILQSKMAGANYVKVQLYDTYAMPGENREQWEYLNISKGELEHLKDFAEKLNIGFFASAFQKDRFQWVVDLDISINKIASSLLPMNFDLCQEIVDTGYLTLCSLGQWDKPDYPFSEENVVYMHCICEYPHHYKRAMELMPIEFESPMEGYSDHCIGIEAAKEAVRRGAVYIEKHFTTNHNLECRTEGAHLCSMDYDELRNLRNFCDEYTGR